MTFSDFLKKYREGINHTTGRSLSRARLAGLIGVDVYRLQKWEEGKGTPKDDTDRLKVKVFFGINDLHEKIQEEVLKNAIRRYPNGLGKIEPLAPPPGTPGNDLPTQFAQTENIATLLQTLQSLAESNRQLAKSNLILANLLAQKEARCHEKKTPPKATAPIP